MKKLHWKRGFWITVGLMPFIVVCIIELVHLVLAWQTVDQAALSAVRYAVTGQFNQNYCEPLCDSEPQQDAARLQSIYQTARNTMGRLLVDSTPSASQVGLARVTVCSERPGYTYDAQRDLCNPHDDPGAPNTKVLVSVAYNYPVGSSLGAGVAMLPLRATQTMIVESFRSARVFGLPPAITSPDTQTTDTGFTLPQDSKSRLIIINGDLQLIAADTSEGLAEIIRLADESGGYVVRSESWFDGEYRYTNVQIRVPAEQFQTVLGQVKELAVQVLRETVTGQDVTEEYVDIESRLQGLRATAESVQGLLGDAQTVDEALHVNTELGKLKEQIEQIIGRMQYLENQDELATLTIALSPERPLSVLAPVSWQPDVTLERALHFLGASARFVGDALIWVIVVGCPVVVIVWTTTRFVKRFR